MTLDVHQLDQILLVGTGVLLLAILAVRLSVGVGLPSLLVYLLMGVALGESGFGLQLRRRRGRARAGLRGADPDPGRGWPDHALARDPAGDAAGCLAGHDRCRRERARDGALRPLRARPAVGDRRAAGGGHLADRRRGGVLGAAPGAAAAPAHRCPGGGVGAQRRPHGRAGHPGQRRWRPRDRSTSPGRSPTSSIAGTIGGLVVGYAGAWLLRRSALPSSGLYPLAVLSFTVLAYAGTALLHGSGFAAVYVAALILGNAELPHRARDPVVLRGGGLARADRAVRDARAAGLPEPHRPAHRPDRGGRRSGADPGGPAALGGGLRDRAADEGARAGLPLLGGAARRRTDRARHHPPRRGRSTARPSSSTSSSSSSSSSPC